MKQTNWMQLALALVYAAWLGAGVASAEDKDGFRPIFDGKTLENWDGDSRFWRVEDGAITGQTTPENPTDGNTFLIWRGGRPGDFELRLKFRIVGGNSGIQYRSHAVDKWVISGYQADIDSGDRFIGILYEEKGRGILALRGEKVVIDEDGEKQVVGETASDQTILDSIQKEQWNDYTIRAEGNHLVQKINGHTTVDVTDKDADKRAMSGLIALQLHAGPPMLVQFKDIRLKRLAADDDSAQVEKKKRVVFLAGKPSHGYGSHEHNAGCLLLARYLRKHRPNYEVDVYQNGWPDEGTSALEGADTVVVYCDGGGRHMLLPHLNEFGQLMDQGVGLVCLHYAVEVPKQAAGEEFLQWMGGYFETHWSVNPHWTAQFESLPDHPITRGVEPFEVNDEWYFHMRFRPDMKGVTPILSAHPPQSTMRRKDGAHSGNPAVRQAVANNEIQHVAWAAERPNGGRGFGFTGGHYHWNWGNDNFRKLVLNAIVWTAHGTVPEEGFDTKSPSRSQLEENQDYPKPDRQSRSIDKRDPRRAVRNLDVHPKLEATLFAAEPMLLSPANIDIDHRGRVWVCEIVNYRRHKGKRPEGDRILILEDTDQDGKADNKKVFYQGTDIDSPHGVCVLGNRVIVSANGRVYCFTDEDGDDKPDHKEIWFSGIGGAQHDHGIHTFLFGPDGKLYFNFGNVGKQLLDGDGNPVIDMAGNEVTDDRHPYQEGMVFRCNLDRTQLETLGWNFRNNWMVTVDSFGSIWQSDNDDDGNRGVRINYVMEFGNYGYRDELTGAGWRTERIGMADPIPLRHWHLNDPGVVPNLLQTGGGSPTGITVYEGDALPRKFLGQLIHCDAGPRVTRAYLLSVDGAGYSAEIENILQGTQDHWFRPSDVQVAPDGSLLVADWYDPGVGGHAMGDLKRGRLFRVTAKGQGDVYRVGQLDLSRAPGAVEALKNPNYSVRYLAWQTLHEMGAAAEDALLRLSKSDRAQYRARALWLLGKIPNRGQHYVETAAADPDPRIRMVAVRLARQLPQVDTLAVVDRLACDDSAQVRRECLIALRHQQDPRAAQLWAQLAAQHDGMDRWYLEALGIAADQQWDAFLDVWSANHANEMDRAAVNDIWWRSRGTQTANELARILANPRTPLSRVPRYLRAFDFLPPTNTQPALAKLVFETDYQDSERAALIQIASLERLDAKHVRGNAERLSQVNSILDQVDDPDRFVAFMFRFTPGHRVDEAVGRALQHAESSQGVSAARRLLQHGHADRFADRLGAATEDEKNKIVQLLGRTSTHQAVPVLQRVVDNKQASQSLRSNAVRSLAKIRSGAERLWEQAKQGAIPERLKPAVAASLHRADWEDVRKAAQQLFPLPAAKNSEKLPSIVELVRQRGSAERGRRLFSKAGKCNTCHVVDGKGKQVGPDLSEIGKKLSRAAMFESILHPSAGISHNYESYVAQLADGNVVTGVLVSQTEDSIELRNSEAITQRLDRTMIDELVKQSVSLMPADLHQNLTQQELVDLVEYLMTLK